MERLPYLIAAGTSTSPLQPELSLSGLQDLLSLGLPLKHGGHQGLLVPLHGAEAAGQLQQGGGAGVGAGGNQMALVLHP